jgi:hypothetical protein
LDCSGTRTKAGNRFVLSRAVFDEFAGSLLCADFAGLSNVGGVIYRSRFWSCSFWWRLYNEEFVW